MLAALALALLAGWALYPDQVQPLLSLPHQAQVNLLAPSEPCAQDENFPFLTSDFAIAKDSDGARILVATAPAFSRIRMHLHSPETLRLSWTARFQEGLEQRIRWKVNGQLWVQTDFSTRWRRFQADLPASLLKPGNNELSWEMPINQRLAFLHWSFAPGQSRQAQPPPLEPDGLVLQPGTPLSFALNSGGIPVLEASSLRGAQLPGVAELKNVQLRVSLRSPGTYWEKRIAPEPGGFRFLLPRSSSGWSRLQLEAVCPDKPLPGQFGLALQGARVRIKSAPRPAAPLESKASATDPARPPVILYLIDTLRADHLGCYGYNPSPSPNLDLFAQDSVRFEDCTAQSGWTKPSTASILSSQWPWGHRVQDFADRLPAGVPWLPEILHQNGYRTAAVATNALAGSEFGYNRGYDFFKMASRTTSEEAHKEAVQWLEKVDLNHPFFLYMHTLDPHSPYLHSSTYKGWDRVQAQEADDEPLLLNDLAAGNRLRGRDNRDLKGRLERRLKDYDFEIQNNDQSFGKLVAWLKAHQIYDQALIVVVSDHGEEFLEHGKVGHVNSLYQELLHVPLIIKFPKQRWKGTVVHSTWQQVDVAPTVLEACGLEIPKTFQGRAYLGQEGEPGRLSFFSVQAGKFILRSQNGIDALYNCIRGVRQGGWVYQRVISGAAGRFEPEELYNLSDDPGQQHNLVDIDPGRALDLAILLEPHFQTVFQAPPSSPEAQRKLMEMLRSLQYVR